MTSAGGKAAEDIEDTAPQKTETEGGNAVNAKSSESHSGCKVQERSQRAMSRGCYRLGLLIGNWPKTAAGVSVLVCLGLGALLVLAEWESRIEYAYVPRESGSFHDFESMAGLFGRPPRSNDCVVRAADGGSMLRQAHLQQASDVHFALLQTEALKPDKVTYEDVCERHVVTLNCSSESVFTLIGANLTNAEQSVQALRAQGDPSLGKVLSGDSSALRLFYNVKTPEVKSRRLFAESNPAKEKALAWEEAFLVAEKARPHRGTGGLLEVYCMAGRSVEDEISKNVIGAAPFMAGAINLILIFLAVLLGGKPCQRSRFLLALGAVAVIQLAQVAGFAITVVCGAPLTDMTLLLVFVAVGVGVDDVIVITDAFDQQDVTLPIARRLAGAFEHAGLAIFLTSITNLVAFMVSATSDLPAIAWFCLTAGWVVSALLVLTLTLYAPLLLLDERRRAAGKYDCLVCVTAKNRVPESEVAHEAARAQDPGLLRKVLKRALLPVVCQPVPAALCVVAMLALAAAGVAAAANPASFKMGLDLKDSFPDGSYLVTYLDVILPRHFGGIVSPLEILVQGVDFGNLALQERLVKLQGDFAGCPQALGAVSSFILPMRSWENCTVDGRAVAGQSFEARLKAFLASPPFSSCGSLGGSNSSQVHPSNYASSIAWNSDRSRVEAVRASLSITVSSKVQGRIDSMSEFRDRFATHGLSGFVYSYYFLFADRDAKMWELIQSTLIYAGITVVIIVGLFVHPVATALIALSIACIDSTLLGLMSLWDIPIDAISFICLAMAVGLSVDYVVHLAHAALENGMPKGRAAVRKQIEKALDTTGASVLKGAVSTLLGVLLLSAAPTAVFRLFFKMLQASWCSAAWLASSFSLPASLSWAASTELLQDVEEQPGPI
eukprot:CAMPEP_0115075622 /NCGR_PEP_ID=MMETSP0227-20121206/15973_1 /TAXON_ID=89957 /ORGANISM="Polarella glacialis, Strain CCMP 1383" /LENGTH=892 /DNA_ID=CAMNT_0002462671 /DNA_START=131 /DNA_END=2810 /DNA_ORIENTATION=-